MSDPRINIVVTAQDMASKNITALRKNLIALGTGTGGALGGVLSGLGVMGSAGGPAFLAGQAISGVAHFMSDAVNKAGDFAESQNKVAVVFGDSSGEISAWAENAAMAMGMSEAAATEAAGTFGNLFTTMGLAQDAASDMSMRVVQLSSDLASFNNASPEDVLLALRSGLVGEIEPLRRFGIAINAAAVEQKALEMGLAESKSTMSEAAKVQARYALILEQSSNAQGDFANTADGLANTQRINSALWEDTQTQIGEALLPAMQELALFMRNDVLPAIKDISGALGELGTQAERFGDFLNPQLPALREYRNNLMELAEAAGFNGQEFIEMADEMARSGQIMGSDFQTNFQTVLDAMIDGQREANRIAMGARRDYADTVRQSAPAVRDAWQTGYLDPQMNVIRQAKAGMKEIPRAVTSMVEDAVGALREGIPSLRDEFKEMKRITDPDYLRRQDRETRRLIRAANRNREQAYRSGNTAAVKIWDDYIADLQWRSKLIDGLDAETTFTTRWIWRNRGGTRNPNIGARASGGPVDPGQTYLVGEQGPELLVMGNQQGNVIPNGATVGGGPMTVIFAIDGQEFARKTFKYFDQEQGRRLALSSTATSFRG